MNIKIISQPFEKFLRNPSSFEINDEDYEDWNTGARSIYEIPNSFMFEIQVLSGNKKIKFISYILGAIYYEKEFILSVADFNTIDNKFKSMIIKWLHDKLNEKDILFSIADLNRRNRDKFWNEMFKDRYIENVY